jgi:hypothetical protein
MKFLFTFLLLFCSVHPAFSSEGGEHPDDFTLKYFMRDSVTGSDMIMEIKDEKLKISYKNGVRNISKAKYYELEDDEVDKLYDFMVTEKFMDRESPEKGITQHMASQYISGTYDKRENVIIFGGAGEPPQYVLRLKYKLFDLATRYDKFWKRDMDIEY